MEYYLAVDNSPKGPYSIEDLKALGIKPEDLIWARGMASWQRADEVPEVNDALFTAAPVPPRFDRGRFTEALRPDEPVAESDRSYTYEEVPECPRSYMWVAIVAFIGIIPLAIVAVIKASMVGRLWNEGKYEQAEAQSRSVLKWAIPSIVIGIPLTVYMYMNPYALNEIIESITDIML